MRDAVVRIRERQRVAVIGLLVEQRQNHRLMAARGELHTAPLIRLPRPTSDLHRPFDLLHFMRPEALKFKRSNFAVALNALNGSLRSARIAHALQRLVS